MHTDLKNSGLASKFKIRPMTDNISLSQFIGKRVRYRRELLTPEFINLHGSISVTHTFMVGEIQQNYRGEPALRGYSDGDIFGRILMPNEMEIIS